MPDYNTYQAQVHVEMSDGGNENGKPADVQVCKSGREKAANPPGTC